MPKLPKLLRVEDPKCEVCSDRMEHIATIPPAPNHAPLYRYRCVGCGCFRTDGWEADAKAA